MDRSLTGAGNRRRHFAFVGALSAAAALGLPLGAGRALAAGDAGAVYTMTNAPGGNAVLVFRRGGDGTLRAAGSFPTGGLGSGAGLGSGHAVVVSRDSGEVVAVNPGSSSVSVFEARHDGLKLLGGPVPSGGARPTSVTIHEDLVYVMNADSNTIAGFRLERGEGLAPIPGAVRPLGAGTSMAAQIQFDRSGRVLIVDERGGAGTIDTFVVGRDGVAGPARTVPASAGGPFGFDVDRQGHVLLSNTALGGGQMSGATSYDVARDGSLTPNGAPVSSGQAAACWLAAAQRFAYTTNAGSGSIGRFGVAPDGTLRLLGTTVIGAGSQPLDLGATRDQEFVYVLANGLHQIIGYRVGPDGGLAQAASVPVPEGAIGLDAA
jgi:6-phosphogluconolactonase (cycloisomerase 2 family)